MPICHKDTISQWHKYTTYQCHKNIISYLGFTYFKPINNNKICTELSKTSKKKDPKNQNGQIFSTF